MNRKGGFERMCWTGGVVNGLLQNEIYTGAVVSLKSMMDSRRGEAGGAAGGGMGARGGDA